MKVTVDHVRNIELTRREVIQALTFYLEETRGITVNEESADVDFYPGVTEENEHGYVVFTDVTEGVEA